MNNAEEIIDYLNELAQQQNLVEQAIEICDEQILSVGGEFNGYKLEDLQKRFRSHSLIFKSDLVPYTYIGTHFDIYNLDNRYLGYFKLITSPDGELIDTISSYE